MDTAKARANILARIRTNQRRAGEASPQERGAVDEYLMRHPAGPRPAIEGDLKIRFRAMAERTQNTVDEVPHLSDAPAAIARYLQAQQLDKRGVIWPTLAHLDWAAAGIVVEARPPRRDEANGVDRLGITGCFCALAETGTLVLLSGPDTHASTHLLPETHVALVPASRIVADMEAVFELIRTERAASSPMMPRSVNMVSGPSRTGDIEQTIVLGAHGPYRVHIVVATDE